MDIEGRNRSYADEHFTEQGWALDREKEKNKILRAEIKRLKFVIASLRSRWSGRNSKLDFEYDQLCPDCAKGAGRSTIKPTKGVCDVCGSSNSWRVRRIK